MVKRIILKNNLEEKEFFYNIRYSKRAKNISLKIKNFENLEVVLPKKNIFNSLELKFFSPKNFIKNNGKWIFKNIKRFSKLSNKTILLDKDWRDNKKEFLKIAKERVDFFNKFYNFQYKNIFIKDTKSRWGSCSTKGNLNFNYRIFLLKSEQRDYVIVHEICHLKEMNHSRNFWNLVEKKSPEYKKIRKSLKEYNFNIL